jgi:hypothetical protein
MNGWTHLTFVGLFLAPWTASVSIVRQKDAFARDQELTFALTRSELEREALDSGVDAANHIGGRARLAETVSRLRERLQSSRPAINTDQLLQQLTGQLAALQSGAGGMTTRRRRFT